MKDILNKNHDSVTNLQECLDEMDLFLSLEPAELSAKGIKAVCVTASGHHDHLGQLLEEIHSLLKAKMAKPKPSKGDKDKDKGSDKGKDKA